MNIRNKILYGVSICVMVFLLSSCGMSGEKAETQLAQALSEENYQGAIEALEKGVDLEKLSKRVGIGFHIVPTIASRDTRALSLALETSHSYQKKIIPKLIEAGADVNSVLNKENDVTYLQRAVKWTDIAEILIDAGANVTPRNNDGDTAIDLLIEYYSKSRNEKYNEPIN